MQVEYVKAFPAAHGWCDHCDEQTQFIVKGGVKDVGTKRLCKAHAEELRQKLESALWEQRRESWEPQAGSPKRSG